MERYLQQLHADIAHATANVSLPFVETALDLYDWISDAEEEKTAPARQLEDWSGILKEGLPPVDMLTDAQVHELLHALKQLLDAYNCAFVLQTAVPERIQYTALRENFDQEVKIKQWHQGFFALCRPGTPHGTCALGAYCQCAFFAELFAGLVDEN